MEDTLKLDRLATELVEAVNRYIIDEYGINPIHQFTDEEDGAYDVVYKILKEKLK